jgi:hypothetical protein
MVFHRFCRFSRNRGKKSRNLAVGLAIAEFQILQCRKLQAFVIGLPGYLGLTENAGHEMQKLEMTDKCSGAENARLETDRQKFTGFKMQDKNFSENAENYTVPLIGQSILYDLYLTSAIYQLQCLCEVTEGWV